MADLEVDTSALRGVAAEVEMLALDLVGEPAASAPVPDSPLAFGSAPLMVQFGNLLAPFVGSAQEAYYSLVRHVNAAGTALRTSADGFDATDRDLAALEPA